MFFDGVQQFARVCVENLNLNASYSSKILTCKAEHGREESEDDPRREGGGERGRGSFFRGHHLAQRARLEKLNT